MSYYRVSVLHPSGWHCRYPRVRKWTVKRCLKKLYAESWDRETIMVERIGWLEDFKAEQTQRSETQCTRAQTQP